MTHPNRRRFLTITAAACAGAALPAAAASETYIWEGVALGARARLYIAHANAPAIAARAAAEISRLEDIFSLFRPESALSRLNRDGTLEAPPFELLACLSMASAVHHASEGMFDPTVQPLWQAYALSEGRPDAQTLAQARAALGWEHVIYDPAAIVLKPGMALTLNGIAQGLIADRVTELLTAEGLRHVLVNTGEFRALGPQRDGTAWPVNLAAGGAVGLSNRALATSAPSGTHFDSGKQMGHILDPRTGQPAQGRWREVSVSARSAALADALSTAACIAPDAATIAALLAKFDGAQLEALV